MATSFGVVLVLSPPAALVLTVLYALIFSCWRISSVASLAAAWATPAVVGLMTSAKAYLLLSALLSGLILWRHRDNIIRLCRAEEPELAPGQTGPETPGAECPSGGPGS